MTSVKIDRRAILAADPKSFNELLDFFESYVTAIAAPLEKACDLIREEFNYQSGDIFGHICHVSHNSMELAEQLKKIRAARNAGTDVAITLTSGDARMAVYALEDVNRLLSEAESVLGTVRMRLDADEGYESLAILSLTHRALATACEREVTQLHKLAVTIKKAGKYRQMDEEEAE